MVLHFDLLFDDLQRFSASFQLFDNGSHGCLNSSAVFIVLQWPHNGCHCFSIALQAIVFIHSLVLQLCSLLSHCLAWASIDVSMLSSWLSFTFKWPCNGWHGFSMGPQCWSLPELPFTAMYTAPASPVTNEVHVHILNAP